MLIDVNAQDRFVTDAQDRFVGTEYLLYLYSHNLQIGLLYMYLHRSSRPIIQTCASICISRIYSSHICSIT